MCQLVGWQVSSPLVFGISFRLLYRFSNSIGKVFTVINILRSPRSHQFNFFSGAHATVAILSDR